MIIKKAKMKHLKGIRVKQANSKTVLIIADDLDKKEKKETINSLKGAE